MPNLINLLDRGTARGKKTQASGYLILSLCTYALEHKCP